VITVHHLNNSRSQRVLWMLEELELPYEIVTYERDPETLLAPAALEAIHPLGKSPVIDDGGIRVAESGAILEYLVDTHGKGRFVPPAGTQAHRDYKYFLHYAEGSLAPFLLLKLVFRRVRQAPLPFFVRPIARKIADKVDAAYADPNLARHVKFLGDHLASRPWFAGDDFTACDVQMSFAMEALVSRARHAAPEAPWSSIEAWVVRARDRPAFQRAIERGGPYAID
jgi:glutathione S-transferase